MVPFMFVKALYTEAMISQMLGIMAKKLLLINLVERMGQINGANFSIIFVLCKVYFNLKYSYICDVGCGGNSTTLCFLPPPQQN